MGIITTYVCDVSGVQGEQRDFITVEINAKPFNGGYYDTVKINKFIHKDVAAKLHLVVPKKDAEVVPEPTLESKLMILLKNYIQEIAYEAGDEAACTALSNRG